MTVDAIGERPTSGRLEQRGVGPVQPQARAEVVTSAAAPWRRPLDEPAPYPRGQLSEDQLFFAYRNMTEDG